MKVRFGSRLWYHGCRVAGSFAVAGLLAGCGYGYVYYSDVDCSYPNSLQPAVIVDFVDGISGARVSVDAAGGLDDGRSRESLSVYRRGNVAGTVLALAGGFGRTGVFDVTGVVRRTPASVDQGWAFGPVRVRGDECGPFTVRLAVVLE